MSAAVSPGGPPVTGNVDSNVAFQDLMRLQLQLQSRIATVRNASENDLSYHAIQEQNIMIKELFSELEEKLEVRYNGLLQRSVEFLTHPLFDHFLPFNPVLTTYCGSILIEN